MLTQEQAESFFVNVLKFPDWNKVKETNFQEFLKQIIQRYQYHCYFHNMELVATPPEKRRPPVEQDSIKIGMQGSGGVCIHQNSFMTLLLQSIGLNAIMSSGKVAGSEFCNHCMCILKMSEDEWYAIDVGIGQPLDGPIPLNKLPFCGKSAGFRWEYRYNEKDDTYEKWQFDGTYFRGKFKDASMSQLRYNFTLAERDFPYFEKTLLNIFTNYDESIFLKFPFLFRCLDLNEEDAGKNGRRFILIFGASMVIYDNENCEKKDFKSYKDLQPLIMQYFPKIDPNFVEKALDYFSSMSTEVVLGRAE